MASTKKQAKDKVEQGEIGSSGTNINYGQIIGEDYNPDLMGRRKFAKYNEMRLGNASVSTSLEAVKLPIISAKYTVKAASEGAQDVKIAEDLEYNLFTHLDWRQILRESLTYLDFGFSLMEEVYEAGDIDGRPIILLDRLSFRKQSSIQAWQTEDKEPGVTQLTFDGKTASIPMNKLFLLSHKREGENYEGISILRTAYANWYYVTTYYKIDALGYERQALGVVDIVYPKGASKESIAVLETAARNIRANGQSFISRPEGYIIQWMDMKSGTLKDPTKAIDHHIREIAKNVQAQFNEIGSHSSSGAYSSSQTQYELFIMAVQAIAETVVENFNRQVVKTWVDQNYNVTSYPKVLVPQIGDDNMEAMIKSLALLVDAGIITPTDADEAYFRDKFDLPDMPDELKGKDRKPKTTKTPPTTDAGAAEDPTDDTAGDAPVKASAIRAMARKMKQLLTDKLYGPRDV